jgi:hypothetical protein
MTTAGGPPEQVPASAVLAADLRPRPGGRARQGVRIAGAFLAQLAWQLIPSPAVHDVVVSRRDDGREVLRIPADDPMLPGDLLAVVRDQLDRMDAETFLADWQPRVPPPG